MEINSRKIYFNHTIVLIFFILLSFKKNMDVALLCMIEEKKT